MISKIEKKIFSLSDINFYIVLLGLVILKNGLHPIGSEWISWVYTAGRSYPEPVNYLSYSLIPVLLSKILMFPTYLIWWLFFTMLTVLFYIYIFFTLKKLAGSNSKKYFIIFFTFTLSVSPLYYLGHYDLFTIFAGILAATTKRKSMVFLAAVIAVGANPEQAMLTSICVFIFSFYTKDAFDIFIARTWTVISLTSYFIFRLIIGQGEDGSRLKIILHQMKEISLDSAGKINFIVFSVFGVGWFFIILGCSFLKNNSKFQLLLLSSIFIPIFFAVSILDRTRVGVAIGTLPILLFLKFVSTKVDLEGLPNRLFMRVLIAYLIIPQIFIDYDGTLRLPYSEFIHRFLV